MEGFRLGSKCQSRSALLEPEPSPNQSRSLQLAKDRMQTPPKLLSLLFCRYLR